MYLFGIFEFKKSIPLGVNEAVETLDSQSPKLEIGIIQICKTGVNILPFKGIKDSGTITNFWTSREELLKTLEFC